MSLSSWQQQWCHIYGFLACVYGLASVVAVAPAHFPKGGSAGHAAGVVGVLQGQWRPCKFVNMLYMVKECVTNFKWFNRMLSG